jgi:hypothetical protein
MDEKEDIKVGDILEGMYVISIYDNLVMCEGITPFDRGEEEEEGCPVGTIEEIEIWERLERGGMGEMIE